MKSIKIFVRLLFIFWIFFVTNNRASCEIFGGVETCAELLQGLAERGLFDSAEILYRNECKKQNLSRKDKYILASSLVYSRTLQILTVSSSLRSKLFNQLIVFESEFQDSIKKLQSDQLSADSFSAEKLELIRLQFRFAVSRYLIGVRIRFESEVAASNEAAKLNAESQKILLTSTEQLKKINSYFTAQQNSILPNQVTFLSDNINLYMYLAEISYTLTIPVDNNRYNKLKELVISFDSWSKGKLEFYSDKLKLSDSKIPDRLQDCYYLAIRARVELSVCYRLLGELDKSFNVLSGSELRLGELELPEVLRLRIAAERIRFLAAVSNNVTINSRIASESDKSGWDINNLLRFRILLSEDSLDYCLAKLEWGLFLAGRLNISDSGTELMVIKDIMKLVRQMEMKIPSSGYCAAVVIGTNNNVQTAVSNPKLSTIKAVILGELAQDRRERNQIEYAVRLFELAGRILESAGDKEAAIKNTQYSISLLYDLLKQLENSKQKAAQSPELSEEVERELAEDVFCCRERIMNLLCGVSRRFVHERDSIALYRRGIDEATVLFKAKRLGVDEYISVLNGYVSCWGDVSDCGVYMLRAANLLEFNGRIEEALVFLDKIPNDSLQALDTILAADRCFKQIRNKNSKDKSDISDINVTKNELSWFMRRLRVDVLEWTEADAVTIIKMAERLFYRSGLPVFYWESVNNDLLRELEPVLVKAIDRCKTAKSVTVAQLNIMLIIANNLQNNHVKSAELLKQINKIQLGLLTELEQFFVRRFQVEIKVMSGDVDGARAELDGMLKAEPRNLMLLELKAEILSRQNDNELLNEAVKTWSLIGIITKEKSDQWWNAREKIISIFIKQGNRTEAQKTYKRLKFLYPDFGNKSRKERIEKLIKEINETP
ncbi:MAG: hypothetical protein LBC74_11375 [Planctomycetaceae bacterium]|jgi:hypothetical protein|nr:hypothetical protein [Planctomycetaceae bacterium]